MTLKNVHVWYSYETGVGYRKCIFWANFHLFGCQVMPAVTMATGAMVTKFIPNNGYVRLIVDTGSGYEISSGHGYSFDIFNYCSLQFF